MKKFNLFKEIIIVERAELLRAASSQKKFAISHTGEIVYEPFPPTLISVFEGSIPPLPALSSTTSRPIASMLGDLYRIVEDDDRILIKAAGAWQQIIGWNRPRSLYDDTSGDGIDRFADKELETIGWHATEFSITYRDIVEHLEAATEGIVLCIEQEDPYRFSGLGFPADIAQTRQAGFAYCAGTIEKKLLEDPDYASLSDDEEEALAYFRERAGNAPE